MELLDASVSGTLAKVELRWSPQVAVCVVMASGGYPGNYEKGKPIRGLKEAGQLANVTVFHAGTKRAADGAVVTDGGRVLGVTGLGATLAEALARAYAGVERIHFDGAHYRRDIAARYK